MSWNRWFVSAAVLLLSACSSKPVEPARERTGAAAISVKTHKAEQVESQVGPTAVGTVRARVTSTVAAQMMGTVLEVRAHVGEQVSAGQLLAVIDAREIEARRAEAVAGGNEARQAIPEAKSAVSGAKASLELAETTGRRMKELFDKKSISPQEFDEAQARVKVARSNVEMAEAKRLQLDERIRQAEENLSRVETMRSYSRVTSPFAGVIVERRIEPGALASPGTPLFVIEQAGRYRFETALEESAITKVRVGTPATVEIESLGRRIDTRVTEIVPVLDAASRSLLVKFDLPTTAGLRSGLFGRVQFALGPESRLMIPEGAIQMQGQVASVLVPEAGQARRRMVTLGVRSNQMREVLSGLEEGERVIVSLPAGLTDGSRVEVKP
jgi:RND family efflux transporter MFP subunit